MTTVIAEAQPVTTLPGEPVPYVIEAGSGRAHVLLGEVGRALVGAGESRGAMSVMALDGPRAERPIPLHFHDSEFEYWYVLRGAVQLWADGESRVLYPGDFGYVPPGAVHAYQLQGHYSTFVGPVVPGGWDCFFDLTGEPFTTAAFRAGPKGPPPFEKFARAEVEFKMKYRPDLEYATPRNDAADDTIPEAQQPFFLRSGEGPRHELAGQLRLVLDGDEHVLTRGDTASIPAGTVHSYAGDGHYTKVLTMSAPGGLEALIARAGQPTDEHIFSAAPAALDLDALRAAADGLDVSFA